MTCRNVIFEKVTELARQHGGLRKAASKLQMSPAYLCQIRSGKKVPSERALKKIGMRRVVYFERVEND